MDRDNSLFTVFIALHRFHRDGVPGCTYRQPVPVRLSVFPDADGYHGMKYHRPDDPRSFAKCTAILFHQAFYHFYLLTVIAFAHSHKESCHSAAFLPAIPVTEGKERIGAHEQVQ